MKSPTLPTLAIYNHNDFKQAQESKMTFTGFPQNINNQGYNTNIRQKPNSIINKKNSIGPIFAFSRAATRLTNLATHKTAPGESIFEVYTPEAGRIKGGRSSTALMKEPKLAKASRPKPRIRRIEVKKSSTIMNARLKFKRSKRNLIAMESKAAIAHSQPIAKPIATDVKKVSKLPTLIAAETKSKKLIKNAKQVTPAKVVPDPQVKVDKCQRLHKAVQTSFTLLPMHVVVQPNTEATADCVNPLKISVPPMQVKKNISSTRKPLKKAVNSSGKKKLLVKNQTKVKVRQQLRGQRRLGTNISPRPAALAKAILKTIPRKIVVATKGKTTKQAKHKTDHIFKQIRKVTNAFEAKTRESQTKLEDIENKCHNLENKNESAKALALKILHTAYKTTEQKSDDLMQRANNWKRIERKILGKDNECDKKKEKKKKKVSDKEK